MSYSVLLNHHLGRFYNRSDGIALLQFEFVSTTTRDGTLDKVVANTDNDMGHDVAKLNLFYFSAQFVSS